MFLRLFFSSLFLLHAASSMTVVEEQAHRLFDAAKINVHIAPHTHDDPGWLKTVDQYYYGSNSSIYKAGVQYILDTVVDELENDPKKQFVYVEMSFFQRWYFEQTVARKKSVKNLVKSGQLSFANGGWCMHDEAGSHFVSMIDQTTLGHRFLKDEFDYTPTVGWQIDPFGHSANQATLLGSDVGFDALYFGRIDYEDREIRKQSKNLEFIWRSMKSLPNSQVFTGVFSDGNYQMPSGFNFDVCADYDPIMDDPNLADYNVDQKVEDFISQILVEHSYTKGNHIMFKMGSDFHYTSANHWYKNLDKIMKHVMAKDDRFNIFYSNPTLYTYAKSLESKISWSVKTDDFFPYADCEHCYWGGYFTSRPTLKYFERSASSYLQVLKQMTALDPSTQTPEERKTLFDLTAAVGLVNHHDAITGTAKQHVTDDYVKILDKAYSAAEDFVVNKVIDNTIPSSSSSQIALGVCREANASICEITESAKVGDSIVVIAYNALPRSIDQQISVYLNALPSTAAVYVSEVDTNGEVTAITSEILMTSAKTELEVAPYTLIFTASNVRPLFYSRFVVEIKDSALSVDHHGDRRAKMLSPAPESSISSSTFEISNDKLTLSFIGGKLNTMKRSSDSEAVSVTNDLYYYVGYGSPGIEGSKPQLKDTRDPHEQNLQPSKSAISRDASTQQSGAYIFRPSRPNGEDLTPISDVVDVKVTRGDAIIEVQQTYSDWASQSIRLRKGSELVELEWTIGPIPIDDKLGKEVISRFQTDLKSEELIYTDANGREFQERLKNYRPTWDLRGGEGESETVAGNYYPVTAAAYIKDVNKKLQLTVLTDRAQGAASLDDGQLELMVHRRLLVDDSRGVGEPLNETIGGIEPYPSWQRNGDGIIVTGKHYLLLSDLDTGMKKTRAAMDTIYQELHTFYGTYEGDLKTNPLPPLKPMYPLSYELPLNVQLLTFETWSPNVLLVRLAHQFAIDEDSELSAPVSIDLSSLLSKYSVKSVTEMGLSANQDKESMDAKKIQWNAYNDESSSISDIQRPPSSSLKGSTDFQVTLNAMEIKTFFINV